MLKQATCCFAGHRDAPEDCLPLILAAAEELVLKAHIRYFLSGNCGRFDAMCARAVSLLKYKYQEIQNICLLAYPPTNQNHNKRNIFDEVWYPDFEMVPKKFAIPRRNEIMVKYSQYLIAYVVHPWGGAAKTTEFAVRQKLTVVNLADTMQETAPPQFFESEGNL